MQKTCVHCGEPAKYVVHTNVPCGVCLAHIGWYCTARYQIDKMGVEQSGEKKRSADGKGSVETSPSRKRGRPRKAASS